MMDTRTTTRDDPQARISTADLAAATRPGEQREMGEPAADAAPRGDAGMRDEPRHEGEELAALFAPDVATGFRGRWDAVQIGFVDDPAKAVREADELVAQVMQSLAESFANERARFEHEMGEGGGASTEHQRVALRRYRSFFQRLLSL